MGVVDKTVDTAGGAVVGGVKGALIGALATIAIPAVILGGIGLLAGGLVAAGWLALGGAALGTAAAVSGATLGGAVGGLWGGAKGLVGDSKGEEPKIDQLLAAERQKNKILTSQLVERQAAASSFENPDAKGGLAAKVQAQQAAAQSPSVNTPS
jgi:predicted lipid-binding transport protein (Tim44 family)